MIKKCICILFPLILLLPLGCGQKNDVPPTQDAEYTYLFQETTIETTEVTGTQAEETSLSETTTAAPATTAVQTTAQPTTIPATATPATTAAPATTAPVTTTPPATRAPVTETTVPATTAPPETTKKTPVCTVTVRCDTVLRNLDKLKPNKAAFVPAGGLILPQTEIPFTAGETAFDVLKRACETHVCADRCVYCEQGGIQLEYTYAPGFDTYYVEGIHQLYEKDCGTMSGWMYSVNGVFPNVGASSYTVSEGDAVVFAYTCDMGEDIGNHY